MQKIKIKLNQSDIRTGSKQNLMAQRMPSRIYKDKKKENKKRSCRRKNNFD